MSSIKKFISCLAAFGICMGIGIGASAFTDMPSGEMGEALENAVEAGLMDGVSDTEIAPYANITRAQMATIIVRAFSATEKSTKSFADIKGDEWYADAVSKAVQMGAFEGDDDNKFNPNNNITFQETYIVLSRMFGFEPYYAGIEENNGYIGDCDESVLNQFSDKNEISAWAKNGAKYIVGNGGWTGIDGKLKPKAAVSRGEFAIIMDTLVGQYIDEPGEYKEFKPGLIMVRSGGVTIDGLKTDKNLVLTYGVDEKGCIVKNSVVNAVTLILGGVDKTPTEQLVNGTDTKMSPDEVFVTISGEFKDVRVKTPFSGVIYGASQVKYLYGCENSMISGALSI